MPRIVFLGPQRHDPAVRSVLDELGISGAVAVITAGWQDREPDDAELRDHLGRPMLNLSLYARAEDVAARDPELFDALRTRQRRLRDLQTLYRLRLDHVLESAREMMAFEGNSDDAELLPPEQDAAIEAVRTLDAHHASRVAEVHREFDATWEPLERPDVVRHCNELTQILEHAAGLLIAGGHVAVLLNRLRLFGAITLAEDRPVIAWSAGAMSLSERVVLFHDSPPQGAGNAEVLDTGLGLAPGILPLPNADTRLRLEDPIRVSIFARRFAPARTITLVKGSRADWDGAAWTLGDGTREMTREGALVAVAS